jgi:hypothetical protein
MDLLFEKKSIANAVKYLTNALFGQIDLSYGEHQSQFDYTVLEFKEYLSTIPYKENLNDLLFFTKIKVLYTITDFDNINNVELVKSSEAKINWLANISKKIIVGSGSLSLHLSTINGIPHPPMFQEVIQHEVNHLYQRWENANNSQRHSKNTYGKWSPMYQIAKGNTDNKNRYISSISKVFYYLDRREQDSYANGLYANLMNNENIDNLENFLENTRQYRIINMLETIYNNINQWDENSYEFLEAKKFFSNDELKENPHLKNVTKNVINNELPRFKKKVRNAIEKYKMDTNNEKKYENMVKFKKMLESPMYLKKINEGMNRHVRIQFDGEKLATRYKGRPIDYSKGSKNPQNTLGYEGEPLNFEYEDQIVNVPKGIQNVFNYIVRVDILLNDNENPSSRYNNDRDEDYTTDNRLNFIINTEYYREGVIIFYDNYKDWDNQTMNTINPEEYLKESLGNKIMKEMGLSNGIVFV